MDQDYNSISLKRWETLRNYNNYEIICYDDYNVDIRNKTDKCLLCGSYNFKSNNQETLNNGYYVCHILDNNDKPIKKLFHRLIMDHYFPQHDKSLLVYHIDQNKKNNNLKNLCWITFTIGTFNTDIVFNTDIYNFVTTLPDDAILCDNTVVKTMRPVYYSETTKQFYEQCDAGPYFYEQKWRICKWTKDFKLTFTSEYGGKTVNICLEDLDKLGISLTKEDIAKSNILIYVLNKLEILTGY